MIKSNQPDQSIDRFSPLQVSCNTVVENNGNLVNYRGLIMNHQLLIYLFLLNSLFLNEIAWKSLVLPAFQQFRIIGAIIFLWKAIIRTIINPLSIDFVVTLPWLIRLITRSNQTIKLTQQDLIKRHLAVKFYLHSIGSLEEVHHVHSQLAGFPSCLVEPMIDISLICSGQEEEQETILWLTWLMVVGSTSWG